MPDQTPAGDEANLDSGSLEFEQLETLTTPVRLRYAPLPLDGSERFQWRLAAVLLALSACRGRSATVEQLHTLVWALNDPANATALESAWNATDLPRRIHGYVSGLLQTLRVAQVEGLVEQAANGRQKLTEAGISFVSTMRSSNVTLGPGDDFLSSIRPITSTEMWRRIGGHES